MLQAGVAEQFGVRDEGMLDEPTFDAVVVHGSALVVRLDLFLARARFSVFADLGLGCVLFREVLEAFLEVEGP